jgi:aspartate aminotransferase
MSMRLSRRISSVGESATIAITAMARRMQAEGIDVVSFGAGEPDFDTPQFIKDAAKAALDAGDTKYTPRAGAKLLQAICDKLDRENHLRYAPDQVLVTFGGKHALYLAFQSLIDEGDEVLIPSPYWVSYVEMVKLAGGKPVILSAPREKGFKIDPGQIVAMGKKTKALIVNSPCNPTGVTYTPDELAALAKAVLQTDLIVFSDEIYEKLIYGQTKFVSFATLDPRLVERTLTFNGLAKTFSMPGWRLGWAAGPKHVIGAMRALLSHSTTNPVSFAQAGALAAYVDPRSAQTIETMRREFELRGRHMAERLNEMPGVVCVEPTGAFYCFPDVSSHYGRVVGGVEVKDSTSFAKAALQAARLALVPGVEFGEDRCVRLSFATSMDLIDKGLDRLQSMLK